MIHALLLPLFFLVEEFLARLAALRTVMAERQVFVIINQFEQTILALSGHRYIAAMCQPLLTSLMTSRLQ